MDGKATVTPALASLITDLEKAIAEVPLEEAAAVIGELGRITALAEAKMIISTLAKENGQPEAQVGENFQHLSVPKVAALLDLPKARVYELIRQSEIPAVRLGKNVRVPLSALQERLAQHQKKGLDKTMYTAYSRRSRGERDVRRGASKNPKAPRADASGPGRSARRHDDEPRPLGAWRGVDPGTDGPIHRAPGKDEASREM